MSHAQYVCQLEDLIPNAGACAQIAGQQVALFRITGPEGESLFAVANHDPFSGANVISRGLVGSVGEQIFVASPVYKQRFNLLTGQCLDKPEIALETWNVSCRDGAIYIEAHPKPIAA